MGGALMHTWIDFHPFLLQIVSCKCAVDQTVDHTESLSQRAGLRTSSCTCGCDNNDVCGDGDKQAVKAWWYCVSTRSVFCSVVSSAQCRVAPLIAHSAAPGRRTVAERVAASSRRSSAGCAQRDGEEAAACAERGVRGCDADRAVVRRDDGRPADGVRGRRELRARGGRRGERPGACGERLEAAADARGHWEELLRPAPQRGADGDEGLREQLRQGQV